LKHNQHNIVDKYSKLENWHIVQPPTWPCWKLANQLHLPWGTFTSILVFLHHMVFKLWVYTGPQTGRMDRWNKRQTAHNKCQ